MPCAPSYPESAYRRDLGQHDSLEETTRGAHPRVEQSHSSVACETPSMRLYQMSRKNERPVPGIREAGSMPTVRFFGKNNPTVPVTWETPVGARLFAKNAFLATKILLWLDK